MATAEPDLSPLDFFMWGYLKHRVYHTTPATLVKLRTLIVEEINKIDRLMLKRVFSNLIKRGQLCKALYTRVCQKWVCVNQTANLHCAVCEWFAYSSPRTKVCRFFAVEHKENWMRRAFFPCTGYPLLATGSWKIN